ncbi:hypothetical protein LTR56_003681 [Elasticomyces elasticus]|nr:hypothetical protein LTR22_016908 [Elasticomyces elasticus]KAK3655259.1 hypothetical protein LTR56_003681 [Elasticomyces elasticus]KAK4913538.1 hypothetical protein LTR49_018154 [Elasticomyces elasticus]KAK5767261.1 hypothetical protein LTS12_002413 [Elasticomyces elasticus]
MSILDLLLVLFSVGSLASPILRRQQPFLFDGDAPYSTDAATLAAALTCPNGVPTKAAPPVLLVHGTSTTGEESWGDGYVPALAAEGYTACYVTLPGRAMGDMQISSEYVAYGLHYISQLSGELKTAVISHSQGGPVTQWALQFFPSTKTVTNSFIPLSPDFDGINFLGSDLNKVCDGLGSLCQASLWQQSDGSKYYDALHAGNFEAQVPTTAIWSKTDGVVNPPKKNAKLPSGKAIAVQDLCPLRFVLHTSMTTDAAVFALALDALQNGGTGSLSRVVLGGLKACFKNSADNMNGSIADDIKSSFDELIDGYLLGSPRVAEEPPVMVYAL